MSGPPARHRRVPWANHGCGGHGAVRRLDCLHAGIAGRAHAIPISEILFDLQKVASHIKEKTLSAQKLAIVVVAEGAKSVGGQRVSEETANPGGVERLGGIGDEVADELGKRTGREARAVVLGHLLRGESPTSLARLLGLNFGAAAVRALSEGRTGTMVALNPPRIDFVPLETAVRAQKLVPMSGNAMLTARALDICFGD